jgi:hypothetical protein
MPKEWNDDEVTALIKENVEIVRQDKLEAFLRSRFSASTENKNDPANSPPLSGNGNPGNPSATKAKKSLFWGEIDDK